MNLKPLSNRVLIESHSEENVTESGIVIPDTAEKKKQSEGKVIAVGPGKFDSNGERIPMSVKAGDTVRYEAPWSDDKKIKDGDKEYVLVAEDEILAIIE